MYPVSIRQKIHYIFRETCRDGKYITRSKSWLPQGPRGGFGVGRSVWGRRLLEREYCSIFWLRWWLLQNLKKLFPNYYTFTRRCKESTEVLKTLYQVSSNSSNQSNYSTNWCWHMSVYSSAVFYHMWSFQYPPPPTPSRADLSPRRSPLFWLFLVTTHILSPNPSPATTNLFSFSTISSFWEHYIDGIVQYMIFFEIPFFQSA